MISSGSREPATVKYWLLFCAFSSWAGWTLSAFHSLNRIGYAIAFALALGVLGVCAASSGALRLRLPSRIRLRKRFTRLCPAIFLIFATLAFFSGALYPANYYDALAYRLPRVMHWLAAERWHWIHTVFQRLNARGCGFEWVSSPLIAFGRSDRPLFLVSIISFCLLPALLFGCLTRLGVKRRVAYHWMWLLPLASCFLLQAGTLGNDLFAAVFVLAGVYYALRACQDGRIQHVWMSLLAAGLATGVKANTIPLILVWAVILAGCTRLLRSHLISTLVVGLLALACSFAPTALLNHNYCGDWTGAAAEHLQLKAQRPWVRPLGNAGILLLQNLSPPLAPFATQWNQHIAPHIGSEKLRKAFAESFLTDGALFTLEELQTDNAGLGLGVCALLGFSVLAATRLRPRPVQGHIQADGNSRFIGRSRFSLDAETRMRILVFSATGLGFLVMMETSFVKSLPRLLCPYYILLITPLLLVGRQDLVVRSRIWKLAVILVAIMSALPLFLRPERPLLPLRPIITVLRNAGWDSRLLARADRVVSVYSQRGNAFAPVLEALPPNTRLLGVVTFDDPESTLWKPFGARRISHLCPEDTAQELRARGIEYVLVGKLRFQQVFTEKFEDWLLRINAEVVQNLSLSLRAADGPTPWYIVRLR